MKVVPVISARLKWVYLVLGILLVYMVANSAYLAAVTCLEFWQERVFQTWFYYIMFLQHILVGLVFAAVIGVFIVWHFALSRPKNNEPAKKLGFALSVVCGVLVVSGILLIRIVGIAELNHAAARRVVYWMHVGTPLIAFWLFWLHRLAGRKIVWSRAIRFTAACAVLFVGFASLHYSQSDSTAELHANSERTHEEQLNGDQFSPSLARTASHEFIPAEKLMNDAFCKECHADVHSRWEHSVHRFSSFNNPAYLASISETKKQLLDRDGNTDAVQWCAGCHDPVPLFSGKLANADFDVHNDPTAKAGITCTVCHAIESIGSSKGNSDFVIAAPKRYPFAESQSDVLRWVSRQLVKAKPAMHKQTFLKPIHKTTEFCSVCHKVHLPKQLNDYKDFLRGQNHYDSFLLSGVSGHGSRSFYYPKVAQKNCNGCHMPFQKSNDFAAVFQESVGGLAVHDHLFPAANTAIPWMNGNEEIVQAHQEFLKDSVRVDLFGIREGEQVDGLLYAPLRPQVPKLVPGNTYLLEAVVRTLTLGHHFTQGTTDSNQIWLHIRIESDDRLIAENGEIRNDGYVDPEAHFINAFVIDREGNRIARRNTQDIFVKVFDHQIPPGAGQTVHYKFKVPEDVEGEIEISARVLYRKFDSTYMEFVAAHARENGKPLRGDTGEKPYVNRLPITELAADWVTLPIANASEADSETRLVSLKQPASEIPKWQRWNDYGIGQFLKGKAELRQAERAFQEVEKLGYSEGPVNLARVYFREGRLDEAGVALERAAKSSQSKPNAWTVNYFSGLVNQEQGHLREAEQAYRSVLEDVTEETSRRGFDFSRDYMVRTQLGSVLFDRSRRLSTQGKKADAEKLLNQSRDEFLRVLDDDSENLRAHYNLSLIYRRLGDSKKSQFHQELHRRYQPDYNAQDRAVRLAREKYPQANLAGDAVTIYTLRPAISPKTPSPPPNE